MNADPTPAPDGWPDRLRQLVQDFKALRQTRRTQGIYREFVRHGLAAAQEGIAPEAYRLRLQAAGLKSNRASEVIAIVKRPEVAAEFTRTDRPIGIRSALRQIRPAASAPPAPGPAAPRARARKQLLTSAPRLVAGPDGARPWSLDCGLFRLRFIPGASAPESPADPESDIPPANDVSLGIPLFPPIEAQLAQLAQRSGLNRAETARVLLQRAPWAELWAAIPPAPEPPASGPPAEASPRQKSAPLFSLHRRKHPVRTPADVCRLAVRIPAELAARLTQLGEGCGRSRPEAALLLLERAPLERLEALAAARATARRERGEPEPSALA